MSKFCKASVGRRRHGVRRGGLLATSTVIMTFAVGAFISAGSMAGASTSPALTGVGKGHVTLTITADSSDQTWYNADAKLFEKAHKNVTVKITYLPYASLALEAPHLMSGGDVPDLINLTAINNTVKDKLLLNLNAYAKAYGWSKWPQSQFAAMEANTAGTVFGAGNLYGMSFGYGLTGVYYNKALAAKIGMTTPPTTLAQFEVYLADAKTAGLLPMMTDAEDGGIVDPLENLTIDFSGTSKAVENWCFDVPNATINTPATVEAAQELLTWAQDGYFPSDANTIDDPTAISDFAAGQGVFFPNGNWAAPSLDAAVPQGFGFFAFPPLNAGGAHYGLSAVDQFSIPAKAPDSRVAAAFLNFVTTNPAARQLSVSDGGVIPAGPANAAVETATAGSVLAQTITVFKQVSSQNGLVQFMQNATGSITVDGFIPETQLLIANMTTPVQFASTMQTDYTTEGG